MPVLDSSTEPQLTANTDDELMELYLSLYDRYISIKRHPEKQSAINSTGTVRFPRRMTLAIDMPLPRRVGLIVVLPGFFTDFCSARFFKTPLYTRHQITRLDEHFPKLLLERRKSSRMELHTLSRGFHNSKPRRSICASSASLGSSMRYASCRPIHLA